MKTTITASKTGRACLLALFVALSLTIAAEANLSARYGLNNRLRQGIDYFTSLPIGAQQIRSNGQLLYYYRGVYYQKAMYQGRIVYFPTGGRFP